MYIYIHIYICTFVRVLRIFRHFSLVDKSAVLNRNMGYPQVPGLIPADVYVYTHIFRKGSRWIFSDEFCHFSSVDKSAALNRIMGYPQVSISIPVETPRTQIHMDLS